MDFMITYSALAMNDGKPQHFLDHTAYLTILSVKSWFQLLHGIGLLDAYTLPAIPPASDAPAFDAAMTQAVRAGRVLMFLIAIGCILIFAGLARRIFRDRRVALLATVAFALSGGVAIHVQILRSELVAACPVIFALMILIIIGRSSSLARPLGIASAAALCVIGLENKVQAILLIGTVPLVILPFGSAKSASVAFWNNTRASWRVATIAVAVALAAAWSASPLIAAGLDRSLLDAAGFRPLLAALQSLVLMLAAIGIDTLAVRRELKAEYCIFTDPLIVLAGAILIDAMSDLRFRRWTYGIGTTLLVLHVVVGQAEPFKDRFKRSGPESICAWSPHYMPLLRLPWCPEEP